MREGEWRKGDDGDDDDEEQFDNLLLLHFLPPSSSFKNLKKMITSLYRDSNLCCSVVNLCLRAPV